MGSSGRGRSATYAKSCRVLPQVVTRPFMKSMLGRARNAWQHKLTRPEAASEAYIRLTIHLAPRTAFPFLRPSTRYCSQSVLAPNAWATPAAGQELEFSHESNYGDLRPHRNWHGHGGAGSGGTRPPRGSLGGDHRSSPIRRDLCVARLRSEKNAGERRRGCRLGAQDASTWRGW